jgi:hypothetical protein
MYNFRLKNPELTNLNDKDIPILNFKYYKQEYRKNKKFDADCCELTMSIWCLLLEQADFDVAGYCGREIYEKKEDNSFELKAVAETDTINSLETELNKFIRAVINRRFNTTWEYLYRNGKKIKNGELVQGDYNEKLMSKSELNRDKWLIENYEELFDENYLSESESKNLSALNEFAKRVHTVGNFMIGPTGFNFADKKRAKGCKKFEDRLDIFMEKVLSSKRYNDWRQWFIQASPVLHINEYFKNNAFDTTSGLKSLRDGDISDWCKLVCTLIENRSNIIIDKLKEILNEIPELK